MDITEAIKTRISTRVYLEKPLELAMSEAIRSAIIGAKQFCDSAKPRLELVDNPELSHSIFKGVFGKFGKLVSAPACLVSVTGDARIDWINTGFIQEQVILELTRLELGTCWVGGQMLFDAGLIQKTFNLSSQDTITNIIAIGYPKQHYFNNAVRSVVGARKRKPITEIAFYDSWGNDATDFLAGNPSIKLAVEMAILSPSASNRQPVRIILSQNSASIFTSNNDGMYSKMSLLDAGIFMSHFFLALEHEGRNPKTSLEENHPQPSQGFSYAGTVSWQ